MRRRHAISPGFAGHYQDLDTSSLARDDSACNFILSVARADGAAGARSGGQFPRDHPLLVTQPPDPAGLFSEGGDVIKLHAGGSLTIPTTWINRV